MKLTFFYSDYEDIYIHYIYTGFLKNGFNNFEKNDGLDIFGSRNPSLIVIRGKNCFYAIPALRT